MGAIERFTCATVAHLALIAKDGASLRRHEDAIRVLALLCAAAPEVIPVDARVTADRVGEQWDVAIASGDAVIARAVYPDALTAVRNASRALLAREGTEGPHCDALREAVST